MRVREHTEHSEYSEGEASSAHTYMYRINTPMGDLSWGSSIEGDGLIMRSIVHIIRPVQKLRFWRSQDDGLATL